MRLIYQPAPDGVVANQGGLVNVELPHTQDERQNR
jgi:hypothetical protein